MIWELNPDSPVPLYLQIRNQVVLAIAEGKLCPGEKLPTVRAFSDESGINTMTISKAYQLLKTEGYVQTDRRSGTVVLKRAVGPSADTMGQLGLLLAELRLSGLTDEEILTLCKRLLKEGK